MTVKDLLTHTSGLLSVAAVRVVASLQGHLSLKDSATLAEVVPQLGEVPLDYRPDTLFRYSSLAARDTLLYLVELVSWALAERCLHKRVH